MHFVEVPWTTPPPVGTRINMLHPLARGLECFVRPISAKYILDELSGRIAAESTGATNLSLVYGMTNTRNGYADTSPLGVDLGMGIHMPSLASWAITGFSITAGDRTTIASGFRQVSAATNNIADHFSVANTAGNRSIKLRLRDNSSASRRHVIFTGDLVGPDYTWDMNPVDAQWELPSGDFGISIGSADTDVPVQHLLHPDGGLATETDSNTNENTVLTDVNLDNPAGGAGRTFFFGAFWNDRKLSVSEMRSFQANPWQIFEPQRIPIFQPSDGGGEELTADSGSYAVTGTAVDLEYGRSVAASSASYAVTGTAVTLGYGRALSAEAASYSLTGTAADLGYGRGLAADSGSYSVSGTAVDLEKDSNLSAEAGAYVLTGTAVTLTYGQDLTADAGAYTVTGAAADLLYGRNLSADSASYVWTGASATLNYSGGGDILDAESGVYALTGTASDLLFGRALSAEGGAYTWTGTAANLAYGVFVEADAGAYAVTGTAATLGRTYAIAADTGAYALTGTDATLHPSGAAAATSALTSGGSYGRSYAVYPERKKEKKKEKIQREPTSPPVPPSEITPLSPEKGQLLAFPSRPGAEPPEALTPTVEQVEALVGARTAEILKILEDRLKEMESKSEEDRERQKQQLIQQIVILGDQFFFIPPELDDLLILLLLD